MRIAIIGRTEILFDTMVLLQEQGHEIGVIITAKEAPEYKKTADDFKNFAQENNIPFIRTAKLDTVKKEILALSPIDIGVSMNFSGIISQDIIDCFPFGILNAHGGDLPRYRGNACQAWAIINGEERIGLCIHKMIGGELDSGKIIARDYFSLTINTKIGEVWAWMGKKIPHLFQEAVDHFRHDPDFCIETQTLNPKEALRCYPRLPEDGHIDWTKDAISILRLINASGAPYAGAYCYLDDEKMVITDAILAPEENFLAIPGQISLIGENYVDVTTGTGKIRLLKVSYQGTETTPNKFIKSTRMRLK